MNCASALHASGNALLDALPEVQYRRLIPHLELVPLRLGQVLTGPTRHRTHVYFPTSGIVSVLAQVGVSSEELAITGREGLIGISVFLEQGGGGAAPRYTVVQHAGQAWKAPANPLIELFNSDAESRRLILRYAQALITQIAQTTACNRHHRILEQLSRWLLLRLDRLPGCEIQATQAQIAGLLGVRREGITAAVADLRRAELVRLKRGRVTVLDRAGLEQKVCECYAVVNKEYARLMASERRPALRDRPAHVHERDKLKVI